MKLIEIAPSGHSCPSQGVGLTDLAPEGSVSSTDVSHVLFSLLANPMEELSTCEAACLAIASERGNCKTQSSANRATLLLLIA